MGCIYQGMGLLLALTIREFFWVPHRFRSGLLVAGIWSNWGDLREYDPHILYTVNSIWLLATAVIMSITAAAPFSGQGDVDLGVAYISVFILVFFVSLTLTLLAAHSKLAQLWRNL
jgi:hypothetical protein